MRASVAISILVSLAALHLPSTFLLPVVAQPAAPGSAAVEAFRAYVDQILEPAVSSRPLSEDRLRRFYQTRLAVETQTKVGEEEFVEFWGELSRRYAHVSLRAALRYEIEQVLEGDGQDQTLVLARFAIDHLAGGEHLFKMPMHALLGCLPGLESNVRPPAECARDFRPTGEGWSWYYTLYRVVRESDGWKIALQGGLIQEIRRTAPRVISRRFEPGTVARGRELTLRVREVLLRSDRTVLGLSIENAGDVEIQVLNPLSLASLRDEKGAAYNTRLLASTIPETVARHSSTLAQLVFDPVPLDSRKLFLDVSDILVGDEVFSLRADISLETVRQAPVTPAPVAGEPLLLYLVSVSRLWLNDAPAYAALYPPH